MENELNNATPTAATAPENPIFRHVDDLVKKAEELLELKEDLENLAEDIESLSNDTRKDIEDNNREEFLGHSVFNLSFAQVSQLFRVFPTGLFKEGDVIVSQAKDWKIPWVIIDTARNDDPDYRGPALTVWSLRALGNETITFASENPTVYQDRPFNDYEVSYARHWANTWTAEQLPEADVAVLATCAVPFIDPDGELRTLKDKFFLPSASELGFSGENILQEGDAFAYFHGIDPKEARKRRQKIMLDPEYDGYADYWLRSAYPSNAYIVRVVSASTGALSSNYSRNGYCAAPACRIICPEG